MSALNMYRVDDDGECHNAIAESEQDALAVLVEAGISNATTIEQYIQDYKPELTLLSPGESITMTEDDGSKKTRTVAEWIAESGRCLFSSSIF